MAGEVDYAALKRGGFMRQGQKDRFSLRLHNIGGALSADDLRAIADVSERFGIGEVHLTARQGVEIPFVKLQDIETIRSSLAEADLAPGVCGPRLRTITACQGNAVCSSGNIDTQKLAQQLDERYFGSELPHKFKVGCTGCHNNCLKVEENDVGIKGSCRVKWLSDPCITCGICVKACREKCLKIDEEKRIVIDYDKCTSCGRCQKVCPTGAWETSQAYTMYFGGQFGNKLVEGQQAVPLVEEEEQLFRICDAAIDYFRDHAKTGERLSQMLVREGRDKFNEKMKEAYDG